MQATFHSVPTPKNMVGLFPKKNHFVGRKIFWGKFMEESCSTNRGLMIRSCQERRKSFTNTFSSNLNTVNGKWKMVGFTLEDKALTSL